MANGYDLKTAKRCMKCKEKKTQSKEEEYKGMVIISYVRGILEQFKRGVAKHLLFSLRKRNIREWWLYHTWEEFRNNLKEVLQNIVAVRHLDPRRKLEKSRQGHRNHWEKNAKLLYTSFLVNVDRMYSWAVISSPEEGTWK